MTGLVAIQFINAALGIILVLVSSRMLGPLELGYVAITSGFSSITLNLVDVRLQDIISRHVSDPTVDVEVRRRCLAAAGIFQICLGIIGWGLTIAIASLTWGIFSAGSFNPVNFVCLSGAASATFIAGFFQLTYRFYQSAIRVARGQMFVQLCSTTILTIVLLTYQTIESYSIALALNSFVSLGIFIFILHRRTSLQVSPAELRSGAQVLLQQRRTLLATNMLGYIKMLHRGADRLLIALVSDQWTVGLYQLARSLTDSMFLGVDILQRHFQPKIFDWVRRDPACLNRFILKSSSITIIFLMIIPATLLPTRFLAEALFGPGFGSAAEMIVILTVPQILSGGIFLWLWPLILHTESVMAYSVYLLTATISLVYVFGVGLPTSLNLTPLTSATILSAAGSAVFPLAFLLIWRRIRRSYPTYGLS